MKLLSLTKVSDRDLSPCFVSLEKVLYVSEYEDVNSSVNCIVHFEGSYIYVSETFQQIRKQIESLK